MVGVDSKSISAGADGCCFVTGLNKTEVECGFFISTQLGDPRCDIDHGPTGTAAIPLAGTNRDSGFDGSEWESYDGQPARIVYPCRRAKQVVRGE